MQAQILDLFRDIVARRRMSTIIVTHDLAIVAQYCQSIAVMYKGQLLEAGPVQRFFKGPVHPYSAALLASTSYDSKLGRTPKAPTAPASPTGCSYQSSCPLVQPICRTTGPCLRKVRDDYLVRCHRAEELLMQHDDDKGTLLPFSDAATGKG